MRVEVISYLEIQTKILVTKFINHHHLASVKSEFVRIFSTNGSPNVIDASCLERGNHTWVPAKNLQFVATSPLFLHSSTFKLWLYH